jgi:hypothetical protein
LDRIGLRAGLQHMNKHLKVALEVTHHVQHDESVRGTNVPVRSSPRAHLRSGSQSS